MFNLLILDGWFGYDGLLVNSNLFALTAHFLQVHLLGNGLLDPVSRENPMGRTVAQF